MTSLYIQLLVFALRITQGIGINIEWSHHRRPNRCCCSQNSRRATLAEPILTAYNTLIFHFVSPYVASGQAWEQDAS